MLHQEGSTATKPAAKGAGGASAQLQAAAAALWALATDNAANQIAISTEGGIEPLVRLIGERGLPEVHRDAAGALWSLAASESNAHAITSAGGIVPSPPGQRLVARCPKARGKSKGH